MGGNIWPMLARGLCSGLLDSSPVRPAFDVKASAFACADAGQIELTGSPVDLDDFDDLFCGSPLGHAEPAPACAFSKSVAVGGDNQDMVSLAIGQQIVFIPVYVSHMPKHNAGLAVRLDVQLLDCCRRFYSNADRSGTRSLAGLHVC